MSLKTPPQLRIKAKDFVGKNRYAEMQVLYQYWFEYLRLSPSYELARLHRTGKLSALDRQRLPKDFDQVLRVFDDFGNLQQKLFKPWWINTGLALMGTPTKRPSPKSISKLTSNKEVKSVLENVEKYIRNDWAETGEPDTLLIAVPLNIKRSRLITEITQILSNSISNKPTQSKAQYQLIQKKTHLHTLKIGIKTLWLRALHNESELWRIGAEAQVSKTYSNEVDPKATKKTTLTSQARQTLTIVTSRALLNANMVAENAARGIFPSNAKHPYAVKFNADEFHQVLAKQTAWAKREKAKYR
jgi:hypothetical protein